MVRTAVVCGFGVTGIARATGVGCTGFVGLVGAGCGTETWVWWEPVVRVLWHLEQCQQA